MVGISVTDELYYIKTYRTHLIIGRYIYHWRTLLYQDVSNTPDHWQGYLSLTNFTISRRIEHTWSLAAISVTDELYYIKTYRTHLIIGRDSCHWRTLLYQDVSNTPDHWQGYMSLTNFTISRRIEHTWSWQGYLSLTNFTISRRIEHTWSLAEISVTDELYYIKTYRTHLFIGRDICHWRTLLYQDVSNTPDHWQGYLSLTNFTISRRIEHTWSLAGISVTDELYYVKSYRTHLIIGRDICHWRTLLYQDVSNTPDHWQGYLWLTNFNMSRRIEHTWSLAGISVTDELYYVKTYRTHLIIGRDICHWRTLLYQDVSNTPDHWKGYLLLTNFTISRRIEHTWSLAGISVTDELYYIKTHRTHLIIGRDICHWRILLCQDVSNTPDHWQGYLSLTNFTMSRRIEHTWSLAGISVTDELYYIKTYQTHLIIGRDICHWRTLLYQDVSNTPDHWQGYLSLTNFTISRRIEHTWSLAGISVTDELYYIKTYRTHLIIGRDICHWRTLQYQDVSNTPDHWQGYLSLTNFTISRRIEHTWSLAGISVTDELYNIKTYRTHLIIGRDICHWQTLLYHDVSNTPDYWQGYLSLTNFTISRRIEQTWSLAGISVKDELYYIKTYRTHLIFGRDICHWRTLLYQDVSNTPDHWQGYMSLTNFTISRRIEHTWSLAGIYVTDEIYYIKTYRTHLIIGRDICHWRNLIY